MPKPDDGIIGFPFLGGQSTPGGACGREAAGPSMLASFQHLPALTLLSIANIV